VVPQTPLGWQAKKTYELGDLFWQGIHHTLEANDQWAAVRRMVVAAC